MKKTHKGLNKNSNKTTKNNSNRIQSRLLTTLKLIFQSNQIKNYQLSKNQLKLYNP